MKSGYVTMKGLTFLFAALISLAILPSPAHTASPEEIMNQEFKDMETITDCEQFIEKYKPDELAYIAVQALAALQLKDKDWPEAAGLLQKYKEYFPKMGERFNKIIALIEASEETLAVKNLGTGVNTEKGEYCPIITADGKKLYFVRSVSKLKAVNDEFKMRKDEDIFVSSYVSTADSEYWGKAVKLSSPICTPDPEAPMGISSDGNTLLLFGNYPASFGRGDIFYTEKTSVGWSEVQHYPEPINSKYFECDAMLTADGKAMIFVSERPGGVGEYHGKDDEFFHGSYGGNTDIYVCTKTDSGWSEAINLGETINTPYCERTPFLHPNGKTLYFSSDGHYGLGSVDVFQATRLSDSSWTEWSTPVNLGKEYNGPSVDWGYRIATSGELAYFSVSGKPEGIGKYDIYSIELKAPPPPVTAVSGKVTDPDGNPLEVQIMWDDLTLNKEAGEAKSDPQTGEYYIVLPAGHKFGYYIQKENYILKSEHLDLTQKKEYAEYTLDIVLHPVKDIAKGTIKGEFKNVFFEIDKSKLAKESILALNRWVTFLAKYPQIAIEIHGHTDNTGTNEHNDLLSVNRARSVVNYLSSREIAKTRLKARGFGKRRPVAANETEEGRKQNRRVEMKFKEVAVK